MGIDKEKGRAMKVRGRAKSGVLGVMAVVLCVAAGAMPGAAMILESGETAYCT